MTSSSPRDAADLRETVQRAAASNSPLRLAGAGRWLEAGRPVIAARRIDLRSLGGIVEYVPGDLTMTAGAGSTLAELQEAANSQGQFLPLDPWGDDSGTLGATLATATAGPLSAALGLPRDVVLGVSVITGTGELIRPGGRVVKNVAGFDLVRLMVGAWGTLGAITEATVRLRALPERDESLTVAAPTGPPAVVGEWLARLRAAPLQPLAMELLNHALADQLGIPADGGEVLLIRLAGNADMVTAQRATLAPFGDALPAPADCWTRLRGAMPHGAVTLRLSAAPTDLHAAWREATDILGRAMATAASGAVARSMTSVAAQATRATAPASPQSRPALAHASLTRGVVRLALPPLPEDALPGILGHAPPPGMKRIFELLPSRLWPGVAPSAVADPLSRGIRLAFDPHAIMNRGILGEEDRDALDGAADAQPGSAHLIDREDDRPSPTVVRDHGP